VARAAAAVRARLAQALGLAVAAGLLHLVLVQPNHPAALTWAALRLFPLELPALLAALVALPAAARGTRAFRGAVALALTLLAALKLADLASHAAFARGVNPLVDWPLAVAGWRLASGAVGPALAAAGVLGLAAALTGLAAALWWATGRWAAVRLPGRWPLAAGGAAMLAAAVAVTEAGQALGRWRLPAEPPGAAFTARVAAETVIRTAAARADLEAFAAAAAEDPYAGREGLLDRIGRDVFVVFVESYGRSSLEHPLYAPTHRATLTRAEADLRAAGLAMRSGWLRAPTAGGRSWLSHMTLATGLSVTDQTRHSAAATSGRRTLWHIAGEAGFRTAAVMPAITLAWPEGPRMGFETVHDAAALDYDGPPFNWVTMPDQFTLARAEALFDDGGPWFAQVALISSHAPWVPVPELVPWPRADEGAAYARWANAGDPPEVVWRDPDRIRAQYRKAVDYSLRAAMGWAARRAGPEAPLMLILGDHPPAGFVARSDSRAVPAHLIGPPALVARAARWGWTPGLLPGAEAPVAGMESFRDRFLAAYSSGAPARRAGR
jgi:hypothetical protein